jgi:hypothetical protein
LLRCALPERDSSLPAPSRRVALHGGEAATRARIRRVDCFPNLQRTRVTACGGSSAVGRIGGWRSGWVASGAGAAHGFIDDVLGYLGQFAVFGLADRPQLGERVLGAAPAASPDHPDRLIDHRAG